MHCVESAYICPGNPQIEFVEIVDKRSSLGSKGEYIDSEVVVVDTDGCTYDRTVRTGNCELLCAAKGHHPKRCTSCSQYRSNLRVAKWILSVLYYHAQPLLTPSVMQQYNEN